MPGPGVAVVRFKSNVVPYAEGAELHLAGALGKRWAVMTNRYPGTRFERIFDDPTERVPDEEAYFEALFTDPGQARLFVNDLKHDFQDIVAEAFVRRPAAAPHDPGGPAPALRDGQSYLGKAPIGIDAVAAWHLYEATGEGTAIADVEQGWNLQHPGLPAGIQLICGSNWEDFDHGTAVLGILVARNTGVARGGAPAATPRPASYYRSDRSFSVSWAIDQAMRALSPGDILLVEACFIADSSVGDEINSAPAETQRDVRLAIDRCLRKGILVIEPAGNSGRNLTDIGVDWSGALIVGASNFDAATRTHRADGLQTASNFGPRVDCFTRGHDLQTLGEGDKNGERYTMFGHTSGAAAVIACAAALLQSLARAHPGPGGGAGYLEPGPLREYLRRPEDGTPTEDAAARPIGSMPNLNKIMDRLLGDRLGTPPQSGNRVRSRGAGINTAQVPIKIEKK